MSQLETELMKTLTGYSRLPPRLAREYPRVAARQKDDLHGVGVRLVAMQKLFKDRDLGKTIDLGGNTGFFCLSLLDEGIAKQATVYDIDMLGETLSAGRTMAEVMSLSEKINYVKQSIDLSFVQGLPSVDTIICLNFLHHGGTLYDVDLVKENGWTDYATQWMTELRSKSKIAMLGLGFDNESPAGWDEPLETRPQKFAEIAENAGWSTMYHANVGQMEIVGVDAAAGKFPPPETGGLYGIAKGTSHPILRPAKSAIKAAMRRLGLLSAVQKHTGTQGTYHFYVFEAK